MEHTYFLRMSDKVFLVILAVACLSIQLYAHGLCTSTCECSIYKMYCKHGDVPTHISSEIRELYIEQFDLNDLIKVQLDFENVQNIQKLDIQADHGYFLPSNSFDKFTNLTHLGLHGKEITVIHVDAFIGLTKLLTLNLSSNPKLDISQISSALNSGNRGQNKEILPNLLSLSVSKAKTYFNTPVDLNRYFFKSVAIGRNVRNIDVSEINIFRLNFSDFEPLCKSVEFVDIRKSIIGSATNYMDVKACKSLRTLDVSGIIIPGLRIKFSFQTIQAFYFFCKTVTFYARVETLLANNVITEHDIEINEYTLDMSVCPFQIQKISLVGNRIKWINMTALLHETTKLSVSELNLSFNGVEYISPAILLPSENIRILDLSNNNLNVMQEKYTDKFEILFWSQTKLYYLNLSYNSLSKIPMHTFSKNILLSVLDISHNNIRSLDFLINQLVNIEKLFVSHNKIYIIEHEFRMDLNFLFHQNYKDNEKRLVTFFVYLEENQFQCTCDKEDLRFIEWVHSTEVIEENATLTCSLEEGLVDVRGTGLAKTQRFCRNQIIKKIAGMCTPIVFMIVILCTITVVCIKRRRNRKLMIRQVIAQIEMGTFNSPHLAFLSHCSEDIDLVINRIYPDLCKHLSEMTRSNESLVCLGDKHFRPGFPLRDEVMRCVTESSVFVAVISRNFCRKIWCNLELGEAYDQKKPIIMLMVEHVEREVMDDFLQKIFDRYAHATWKPDDKGGHIEPEWKVFCKSIIQLAGKSTATAKHV